MKLPEITTGFTVKLVIIIATVMALAHFNVHILITNDPETVRCMAGTSSSITVTP
jgi:type III secretory pathway component EscS